MMYVMFIAFFISFLLSIFLEPLAVSRLPMGENRSRMLRAAAVSWIEHLLSWRMICIERKQKADGGKKKRRKTLFQLYGLIARE